MVKLTTGGKESKKNAKEIFIENIKKAFFVVLV